MNKNFEKPERNSDSLESFIAELTKHQTHLLGFIAAAIGNVSKSQDILQNTNLSLWAKAEKFDPSKPFLPWALTFARYEVLAFTRDRKRDRHAFNTEVVELMIDSATTVVNELSDRQIALRHCVERLSADHRQLLRFRYANQVPLAEIAEKRSTTVASVKCMLGRIRQKLAKCVSHRIATSQHG